MFAIILFDGTTQLDVIFGNLAKNLLGITTLELMKNEEEVGYLVFYSINKSVHTNAILLLE